jgi:dTDP-4-amino-4,6-dideoxygalactose transaminase
LQADLVSVLVEPKLETYNIDPNLIYKNHFKTKAFWRFIYGQLAEMEAINEIASANDLLVIEDAAQAHGATLSKVKVKSRVKVRSLSDAAAFSFGKI